MVLEAFFHVGDIPYSNFQRWQIPPQRPSKKAIYVCYSAYGTSTDDMVLMQASERMYAYLQNSGL